jgi:hypothetical protein
VDTVARPLTLPQVRRKAPSDFADRWHHWESRFVAGCEERDWGRCWQTERRLSSCPGNVGSLTGRSVTHPGLTATQNVTLQS